MSVFSKNPNPFASTYTSDDDDDDSASYATALNPKEKVPEKPKSSSWFGFKTVSEKIHKLGKITDRMDRLSEKIDEKGLVHAALESIGISRDKLALGVSLAMDIGFAIYQNDKEHWVFLISKLGAVFVIEGGVEKIWSSIRSLMKKRNHIVAQNDTGEDKIQKWLLAGLTAIIMLATGYVSGGFDNTDKNCKSTWDIVSKKGRDIFNIKSGVTAIVTIFSELQEMLFEVLCCLGLAEGDSRASIRQKWKLKIYMYSTKLSSLSTLMNKSLMERTTETKETYKEVVELHETLLSLTLSPYLDQSMIMKFNMLEGTYKSMCSFFSTKHRMRSVKVDPVHISFYGAGGIGKSSVMTRSLYLVMKYFGMPIDGNIYYKAGASKYMDGYQGQEAIMIDEKDVITDKEFVQVFNEMASGVPSTVNMATLEQKGTPFSSKIIFSTTNVDYPKIPEVNDIQAYFRRRVLIECVPTPDFLNTTIDREKTIDNYMLSHLTFNLLPSSDARPGGVAPVIDMRFQGMDFREMISCILGITHEKLTHQHRTVKAVEPDFPFEVPTPHFNSVEMAIAELIVEARRNVNSYDYASRMPDACLPKDVFELEMKKIVPEVRNNGPHKIKRTQNEIDNVERKIKAYVSLVNSEVEKITKLRPQNEVDDQSDDDTIPSVRVDLTNKSSTEQFVRTKLSNVKDFRVKFRNEKMYIGCKYDFMEYFVIPSPNVLAHVVLSWREQLIDCAQTQTWTAMKKFGMKEHQYEHFMRTVFLSLGEMDDILGRDKELIAWIKIAGIKLTREELTLEGPSTSKTVYVSRTPETSKIVDSEIWMIAKSLWSEVKLTSTAFVDQMFPSAVAFWKEYKEIFRNTPRIFVNDLLPKCVMRYINSTTGKVGGDGWKDLIFSVTPFSYGFLKSAYPEFCEEYKSEARRTGLVRNGHFYFVQSHVNDLMDLTNNPLGMFVTGWRFVSECIFYACYQSYGLCDFVAGTAYRWFRKFSFYVWAKIKEHPWISLLLGAVAAGAIYYMMRGKKKELKAEGAERKVQGHDHKDVPDDGKPHSHIHQCIECNNVYAHAHAKHPLHVSQMFTHHCRKCRVKINKVSEASKNGFLIDEEDANVEEESEKSLRVGEAPEDDRKVLVSESFGPKGGARKSQPIRVFPAKPESFDFSKEYRVTYKEQDMTAKAGEKLKVVKFDKSLPDFEKGDKVSQGTNNEIMLKMDKILPRACVDLRVGTTHVSGLIIGERKVLIYRHAIERFLKDGDVLISAKRNGIDCAFYARKSDLRKLDDFQYDGRTCRVDLGILDFNDAKFAPGPNLLPFFMQESKHIKANNSRGIMYARRNDNIIKSELGRIQLGNSVGYTSSAGRYDTGRTFYYEASTVNGECGSILVADNSALQSGVIVGMHIAGNANGIGGYSVMITREMIEEALDMEKFVTPECPFSVIERYDLIPHSRITGQNCDYVSQCEPLGSACLPIGYLRPRLRLPTVTDIHTSPLFDYMDHEMEPVPLTRRDPRLDEDADPILDGTKKFNANTGDWDRDDMKRSIVYVSDIMVNMFERTKDFPARMLSEYEAINGLKDVCEPLNWTTAVGFPMELKKGPRDFGKRWLFHEEPQSDGSTIYTPKEYLRKALDMIYAGAAIGEVRDNMVKVSPKSEKRKINRVQQGKVRLFTICNVAWLITLKRVSGVFNAVLLKEKWHVHSTLGIDVHGLDPTLMISNGLAVGPHVIEGDFENWDGNLSAQTLQAFQDVVHRFNEKIGAYDRHDAPFTRRAALTILRSMTMRFHVYSDVIWEIFTCMDSGIFTTSSGNTICNLLQAICVWLESVRDETRELKMTLVRETLQRELKMQKFDNFRVESSIYYPDVQQQLENTQKFLSIQEFRKNCWPNYNGDDLIAFATNDGIRFFNPRILERIYKRHGAVYTPPDKSVLGSELVNDGVITIDKAQFLKSTFERDEYYPHLWRMKMLPGPIHDLPVWIRDSADEIGATESNICDSLRFKFHHGRDEYEKWYAILDKACRKTGRGGVTMPIMPYDELEAEFYAKCGVRY